MYYYGMLLYSMLMALQLIVNTAANTQNALVIRSKRNTCCPKVFLKNCNDNVNDNIYGSWNPRHEIRTLSNVIKGCANSVFKYNWKLVAIAGTINKKPLGTTQAALYILKYSLTPGKYAASLEVTEINDNKSCVSKMQTCILSVVSEQSYVIINGGISRTVPDNERIFFEGVVKDYNSEYSNVNTFKYKWSCKISNNNPCKIEKHNNGYYASIMSNYSVDGYVITVTLIVTNSYQKTTTVKQEVHVKSLSLPMTIRCLKNCFTTTNSLDVVVFLGSCGEQCKRTDEFKWTVTDSDDNAIRNIVINDNVYFSTKFDTLEPDKTYLITLLVGQTSYSKFRIKTDKISIPDCSVTELDEEDNLKMFKVYCWGFEPHVLYQLYQSYEIYEEEHLILLGTENVPYFESFIGTGKVFIRIYKSTGYCDNVEVPNDSHTDAPLDVLPYLKKTLPQLTVINLQERAVQIINCLLDSVDDSKEIKKIGFYLLEILKLFPTYNMYDLYQLGTLMGKLILPDDDADPVYQAYISSVCAIISRKFMEYIVRQKHRKELFVYAEQFQEYMDVCATYALNNKNAETETNPTEEVLNDDYPNYEDLEKDYRKYSFIESTQHAMATIRIATAALAHTLNTDEIRFTDDNKLFHVTGALFPELDEQKFQHDTITVYLNSEQKSITVATTHIIYMTNIFWWHKEASKIGSVISDLNMYLGDTGQALTDVVKDVTLVFQVTNREISEVSGSVTLPANKDQWVPKIVNYKMTVHRFNAPLGSNILLIFDNLVDAEFVVNINQRPQLDDFKNSVKITKPLSLMYTNDKADGWFYVVLLPQKGSSGNGDMTWNYNFKYAIQSCNVWDINNEDWSTGGCRTLKPTDTNVNYCTCNHLSTFMSSVASTKNKNDPILVIPFVLELRYTYIIPIVAIVFFFLYLIFIYVGTRKTRTLNLKEKLFFLADNVKSERYGYLLIVKTGSNKNCGTSSNICIKIIGSKSSSQEHVINYPDPEKRLLQRNSENWFILTTKEHLGDLIEIHLWFDCVGVRSSWCCNFIRIYDLQLNEEWIFQIDSELTVLEENKTNFIVKPTTSLESGTWKHKLKSRFRNYKVHTHSWNIFNKTDDFLTYTRRVTLLLSTIYMIFTISLFIISSPCLMLKDGLDYGHYDVWHPIIFIATFVSSILSFGIHLGIQLLFQIALISLLLMNLTILMIFGYWIPYFAMLYWITSVFLSLICTVLIFENIFLLIRVFFFKQIDQTAIINIDMLIMEAESQRLYLYKKFGDSILRPYLIFKYEPLTQEKIKYKSIKEKARYEFNILMRELFIFLLYVVLLLLILISSSSPELRKSNESIKQLVLESNERGPSIELRNYPDIYDYINDTLIARCFPDNWYADFPIDEKGLTVDVVNYLIGIIKLRQKRVVKNTCPELDTIYAVNMSCVPEYHEYYAGSFPDKPYAGRYKDVWKEEIENEYNPMAITYGNVAWYSGSGFVATLGRNSNNSMHVLQYLKDNNWIDQETRLILIKFWTYNANDNVFNTVNIVLEKSATGLFVNSHFIYTTKLFSNTLLDRIIYVIISLLFMLITLQLTIMLITKFYKSGFRKFLNFWNIFDFIIISMTIILITLYIYRMKLIQSLMISFETMPHNEFISFADFTYISRTMNAMAAILMCFAIIRLWKYLRVAAIFHLMEITIVTAKYVLLITFVYNMIVMLAFAFAGYILFGAKHNDFKNLGSTFTTLMLLSLNLYFKIGIVFIGVLSCIYYSLFTIFLLSIYTLYVSILVFHYSKCCREHSNLKQVYTIEEYLKEEFAYYKELIRVRLRGRLRGGQQDEDEPVYPKLSQHRYADVSIMSSRDMEFMALVARGVIRNNYRNLSGKELGLIKDVINHIINKNKRTGRELFYETYDDVGIKLIPDDRILKMERIAKKMFQSTHKTEPRYLIIDADSNLDRLKYYDNVLILIGDVFGNITFSD